MPHPAQAVACTAVAAWPLLGLRSASLRGAQLNEPLSHSAPPGLLAIARDPPLLETAAGCGAAPHQSCVLLSRGLLHPPERGFLSPAVATQVALGVIVGQLDSVVWDCTATACLSRWRLVGLIRFQARTEASLQFGVSAPLH